MGNPKIELFDFTYNQAFDIMRMLWPKAHDPFVKGMAESLQRAGYKWLTNDCIDSDEAEWISNYLGLKQ